LLASELQKGPKGPFAFPDRSLIAAPWRLAESATGPL
jgi:hypothetical protein